MLANGTGTTVTEDGRQELVHRLPGLRVRAGHGEELHRGGRGGRRHGRGRATPTPFPNDNFSTFLLKAPTLNPKPDVLGTMQAGGDLVNLVKQYNEFKLRDKGVEPGGRPDVHHRHPLARPRTRSPAPPFTDAWYWNFDAAEPGLRRPVPGQDAGPGRPSPTPRNYSAAMQYLEAVQAAGTDDADDVVKHLEGKKINDVFLRNGKIRAEDHRVVHDAYLAQVKPQGRGQGGLGLREDPQDHPGGRGVPARGRPTARCDLDGRDHAHAMPLRGTATTHGRPSSSTRFNGPGRRQLLRAAGARAWRSSSACSAWSTSPTARSTCSARSARTCCSTSSASPFWPALRGRPARAVRLLGMVLERALVHRLAGLDPLYNFLLTFGLTLILQDLVKRRYGVSRQPYEPPALLAGRIDLGLFDFPAYQVFVLAVLAGGLRAACGGCSRRTRVGMVVRAATERPELTRALGINVGRWVTPVFGFGIALAGLAGVLAAPMRAVNPLMGADLIIVVFAVVVIGGLGSIFGSVAAGFLVGLVQAWGQAYVPRAGRRCWSSS